MSVVPRMEPNVIVELGLRDENHHLREAIQYALENLDGSACQCANIFGVCSHCKVLEKLEDALM